jgi:hypothetical protein
LLITGESASTKNASRFATPSGFLSGQKPLDIAKPAKNLNYYRRFL